jgi:hypothetical protein
VGQAKKEMMRHDDLVAQATGVALQAKAVKTCDLHEDVILEVGDPEADRRAYAIGTNMVKAGEVDGTREEFMAAIKEAIDNSAEECGFCAKHRDE